MEEDEEYMSIELNYHGIKCIHDALKSAVDKWPGGDPQDQEDLIAMRDNFYRLLLEYQFNR